MDREVFDKAVIDLKGQSGHEPGPAHWAAVAAEKIVKSETGGVGGPASALYALSFLGAVQTVQGPLPPQVKILGTYLQENYPKALTDAKELAQNVLSREFTFRVNRSPKVIAGRS